VPEEGACVEALSRGAHDQLLGRVAIAERVDLRFQPLAQLRELAGADFGVEFVTL